MYTISSGYNFRRSLIIEPGNELSFCSSCFNLPSNCSRRLSLPTFFIHSSPTLSVSFCTQVQRYLSLSARKSNSINASFCTEVHRYLYLCSRKSNAICLFLPASPTLNASFCTQVHRYLYLSSREPNAICSFCTQVQPCTCLFLQASNATTWSW